MVFKHFRDLRVWHLKCLTKAFHGRETRQLWTAPLSPPKKMLGAEDPPPGACFKCGHGAEKKNCLSPQQLPRRCPDCGQTGHWGVHSPALPRQGRPVLPKFLLHRKVCQIFWAWQPKTDAALGPLSTMTMVKLG